MFWSVTPDIGVLVGMAEAGVIPIASTPAVPTTVVAASRMPLDFHAFNTTVPLGRLAAPDALL